MITIDKEQPDITVWYKNGNWFRWNRYKFDDGTPTSNSIYPLKMFTIFCRYGDGYSYWDFQRGEWSGVLTINCLTQNKKMCDILCKEGTILGGHKGTVSEYAAIRTSDM